MIKKSNSIHIKTARHQPRGYHGWFINSHSPNPPNTTPNTLNSPNPPNPPNFLILLWNKLTKLSLRKFTTMIATISLIATNSIFLNIFEYFFPHSSPILHRPVAHQGILKTSGNGQYSLKLPDSSVYILYLKPSPTLNSLKNLNEVVVKGNLTFTPYVIENAEIYPVNITTPDTQTSSTPPNSLKSPTLSTLPKLYSSLNWETEEEKILVFTSGKRRLDMQGVHLESSQVSTFPQGFMDYYQTQLTNLGFKQTLNSKDPDGVMETFAKDDKYFTFGVKNIYSGTQDNKSLIGYIAFLEHN